MSNNMKIRERHYIERHATELLAGATLEAYGYVWTMRQIDENVWSIRKQSVDEHILGALTWYEVGYYGVNVERCLR